MTLTIYLREPHARHYRRVGRRIRRFLTHGWFTLDEPWLTRHGYVELSTNRTPC